MAEIFNIVLIGGPFDGDEGVASELPPVIWAAECIAKVPCPFKVHWYWGDDVAGVQELVDLARYNRSDLEEGVDPWPYVYGEMADPLAVLETAETLAEPVVLFRTGDSVTVTTTVTFSRYAAVPVFAAAV